MLKINTFLLFFLFITTFQSIPAFSDQDDELTIPNTSTESTLFFNNNGTCRDFAESYLTKTYTLGKECGGKTVHIGFMKYENNRYDIDYCVPKLEKSPFNTPSANDIKPARARVSLTLEKNKIELMRKSKKNEDSNQQFLIEKNGRLRNQKKIFAVYNNTQLDFYTHGYVLKELKGKKGKDERHCDISINNFGTNSMTISGAGGTKSKPFSIKDIMGKKNPTAVSTQEK